MAQDFPQFRNLPAEIRCKIWKLLSNIPRTVALRGKRVVRDGRDQYLTVGFYHRDSNEMAPPSAYVEKPGYKWPNSTSRAPAVLSVNRESRYEGLKCYTMSVWNDQSISQGPPRDPQRFSRVYTNNAVDTNQGTAGTINIHCAVNRNNSVTHRYIIEDCYHYSVMFNLLAWELAFNGLGDNVKEVTFVMTNGIYRGQSLLESLRALQVSELQSLEGIVEGLGRIFEDRPTLDVDIYVLSAVTGLPVLYVLSPGSKLPIQEFAEQDFERWVHEEGRRLGRHFRYLKLAPDSFGVVDGWPTVDESDSD